MIRSNSASEPDYVVFHQAIQFLLEAGLSTRQGDDKLSGPSLSNRQISDPKILATLLGTAGGKYSLSEPAPKKGDRASYRLTKDGVW